MKIILKLISQEKENDAGRSQSLPHHLSSLSRYGRCYIFSIKPLLCPEGAAQNFDKLPGVVSLESAPAGPENHKVKNWKGLEAWSREEVGLLSHMA